MLTIRDKFAKIVATHPTLVTFGISLAIMLSIAIVIGILDPNQAMAGRIKNYGQSTGFP